MNDRFGEMLDTPPAARDAYFTLLSRLTPAERARTVVSLSRAARAFARAGIRRGQPGATESEIELELVSRMYGAAVARRLAPFMRATRG